MRSYLICLLSFICIFPLSLLINIKGGINLWEQYKLKYGISFEESENEKRMSIFFSNIKKIEFLNEKNNGIHFKMNHFGHLTESEFMEYVRGSKRRNSFISKNEYKYVQPELNFTDIDWRKMGIDKKVYDQKGCGACYAFSTTGQLESQYAIIKKSLIKLSEQDIVDCSRKYGNEGCVGGWMNASFDYIKDVGINKILDYPYIEKEGNCKHNNKTSVLKVSGYTEIKTGNEKELIEVIQKFGPVSVAIDAQFDFQFYSSGVYRSKRCSKLDLDHAVLAVGLGSKSQNHYIIKNSWGSEWGMGGYMLMAMDNNMCGIATAASYATIKD